MKVRYIPEAAARFAAVLMELGARNPVAADRFARKLESHYQRLAAFPHSGAGVHEFPDLPVRQFIVEPFRFFYVIDTRQQTIWIVDLWHGAQLALKPRLPRELHPSG